MRDFQLPGRSAVYARNGMCATSHPLAAKVAIDILEQGGNAVDAAIAGAVLLGICEPQMTGIGGDCFVLLSPSDGGKVIALNGSGRSPAALSAQSLRDAGHATMPVYGVQSVTVPGAVDAFCRLSADWGRLGLDHVLAPAIRYAEEGVPVAPRVAADLAKPDAKLVGAARRFFLDNGRPFALGSLFRAPAQAEVLRRIAKEGRAGFYDGEVAEDMVASLRAAGGLHTEADFANTACDYTEPVSGTYHDIDLVEHPPNGQGATAILMLNILSHFDFSGLDPFGIQRTHLEAEVAKLAYDARDRFIADPDLTARLEHMLAPETAAKLAALIKTDRVLPPSLPGTEAVHRDTIYITVVDANRMSVSLIYSIYHGFGSGIASDKFGILFQNRGAGFTLARGHPNEAGGTKRPMHTIIPGMLRKAGRVIMPFGVMGGAFQPAGHARLVTNLTDFGLDLQTAIDAPRSFVEGPRLLLEHGYDAATLQGLRDLGHDAIWSDHALGGGQAIRIGDDGVLIGASDPRKDGIALGY